MQSHQTMPPRRTIDVLAQMIPFGALGLLLACHGSDLTYNSGVPVITTQPLDQTVLNGTTATFTCVATGNPAPAYTWSVYNTAKGWWSIAAFAVSGTYTVPGTAENNGKSYKAIAFNSETSLANSNVVTLAVVSGCVPGIRTASGIQEAGYWLDGSWTRLSTLPLATGATVDSVVALGANYYATGYTGTHPAKAPAYWHWNGSTWDSTTPTYTSPGGDSEVLALAVDGSSHVCAAGYTTSSGDTPVPTCWVDGTPTALPLGSAIGGVATSVAVSGAKVYVGGYVMNTSGGPRIPGYWDVAGNTWTPLAPVAPAYDSVVNALAVSGSSIYAGGYAILDASGVKTPGYWNASGTWVALTPSVSGFDSVVNSLLVLPSANVYASGYFTSGVQKPGYWANGTWSDLPGGQTGYPAWATGLTTH